MKVSKATSVRFLLESDQYYRALYEWIPKAKHSIYIAGWDFDFRTNLVRDDFSKSDLRDLANPDSQIGERLTTQVENEPDLNVYLLIWDHPPLYSPDREAFAEAKAWLTMPERIHFQRDDLHPFGASQHQKLVVIDDTVAFVGGMDISSARWDTKEHRYLDPRRNDHVFKDYQPYHDVQVELQGPIVKDLAEVFQKRWERTTHEKLPAVKPNPDRIEVNSHFKDVNVAIARTHPRFIREKSVREIEKLYADMIDVAKDEIYIENQYIASDDLVEKLCKRLSEKDGPRVTFVLPGHPMDWIEEKSMGSLKSFMIRRLTESAYDKERICVFYPQSGRGEKSELKVHSKLMIVDNRIIRAGSSNFNNRSMGLDRELDVALEFPERNDSVIDIKCELLSNLISIDKEQIKKELSENPDINQIAKKYADEDRRLVVVKPRPLTKVDEWIRSYKIVDTKNTTKLERLLEQIFIDDSMLRWRNVIFSILGAFLFAGLASFFIYWTQGSALFPEQSLPNAVELIEKFGNGPLSWLWLLLAYAIAGAIIFPLNLFILAVATIYEPLSAMAISIAGGLMAGSLSFIFGRYTGPKLLKKLALGKLGRMTNMLSGSGWLAIALVRLIPIAPFSIANMACGAFGIKLKDFAIGTVVGLLPGVISITLFQHSLIRFVKEPSAFSAVMALVILLITFFFLRGLRRRFLGEV